MSYRSVSFVPAVFACVVTGANIATVTDLRAQQAAIQSAETSVQMAQASDSCLSAPKGATPAGSHWYYRIDRVTKRQCWYLREENEKSDDKFARAAPPPSTPASADASQTPMPTPRKFSEARAEYVAQQSRAEANPPARAETRSVVAEPAAREDSRAEVPNVLAPAPLSSVRWNEKSAPGASPSPAPAPMKMAAVAAPAEPPQPAPAEAAQPAAAEQPYIPVAAEPAKPAVSLQKLLLAIAAALALAGITVSAIVRIGRMRARRAMKRKRTAMWDTARSNKGSNKKRSPQPTLQPAIQEAEARPRRAAAPHQARAPQDRGLQDRHVQDRHAQDRALQDRARAVRERPRMQPERSYAPPDRRTAPQERAPQDREHQVTEMLSRLARSAQH